MLALGHLGHRPVKGALEDRLNAARPEEVPRIVEALVGVADDETAVALGRVAERAAGVGTRTVIMDRLAEFENPVAARWLARLADHPSLAV